MTTKKEYHHLQATFMNPLCNNREQIHTELIQSFEDLIKTHEIPYYCPKCERTHFRGKIHDNHKEIDGIKPELSKINEVKYKKVLKYQVVGIYYQKNKEILNKLEKGDRLILKREPDNKHDNYAVSVWYEDNKFGYLPRYENKEISIALKEKQKIDCILENPCSSIRPRRAKISIEIFKPKIFNGMMKGLIEMASMELSHKNLFCTLGDYLYKVGYNGFRFLETKSQKPNVKLLLNEYYKRNSISTPGCSFQGQKLSIIL